MGWDAASLPDASGRTVVITGANAGVGYFTAEQLARAGAHVVLACRDPERAEAAVSAIRRRVTRASVEAMPLDVTDRRSIDAAAEAILEHGTVDALVLNAGIVHPPRSRRTDDEGNELVLSTNVLGHFRLVARALPALTSAPDARVVTLGSLASRLGRLRLDDLQLERSYTSWRAYAGSKIAAQAFGFELDRRFRASATPVRSIVVHPGYSTSGRTPGIRGVNQPTRLKRFADNLQAAWTQGKDDGAHVPVRAVLDADIEGGDYLGPALWTKGAPVHAPATRASRSPRLGARLWPLLEQASGQPFALL
ncbi:SDR family NAD(P)-dependent oxidoreductase [Leifsonia shinshuensis]|uniref:SDR family NAD(P)-dependent oxidoreductase n=1 Tax=Leifsonia shinshuensis TaxID=150026 RepID=UPI002863F7BC|nr:SDR family NAD(P)-dependent oxidoreductase [Leifsonia shinshuensis]MDR6971878.1 NAD(P)-dependent dehydrogenase (short-subunit alcohol dehydrogenase family) [Leifsonia shinshuensis]